MSAIGAARDLAARIEGAKLVELPGDTHLISEEPTRVIAEIERFVTGAPVTPKTDRVLLTVLFTDIVASTERAAELGDTRWRELLAAHDDLLVREVKRQGGRVVDTTGDGVFATFDGPARAVRCARTAAETVRQLGVEIRAGVHTGECELIGDDVGGIAVHIGARVVALAGPREVLVSSTVKDLVVGSGLRFEDRGIHELKGVPDDWRLFAVIGDGPA